MNGKYKSKVLAGLLSLFMVLGVILSPLAYAKEEGNTQTYGNINIYVPRNGDDAKEDAKPRQFRYFKVSDKESTNEELEALYKKFDAMKMEDIVKDYGEGTESGPSEVKTAEDGNIYDTFELRGLPTGTYVLKETEDSANNHEYKLMAIAWCSQEGVTDVIDVRGKFHEGKPLILNKVGVTIDEKGNKTEKKLSGVKFNLIDIDKEKNNQEDSIVKLVKDKDGVYSYINDSKDAITDLVTNENGKIIVFGLPKGNYRFKELESVDDFIIGEDKEYSEDINFIPSNGKNITVTNEKEEKNTLHLKKIDGTDPKITLAGVEFELYAASGNDLFPVGVDKDGKYIISDGKNTEGKDLNFIFKTDENGSIILTDLPKPPAGYRYEFREVKTLDDYVLVSDRTYPAEFGKAITVENYKDEFIEINLTKKDQITPNKVLDKVGFQLYRTKINKNEDGTARKERELVGLVGSTGSYQFDSNAGESNLIYQLYTNEKGKIKVTGLPDGDYYFKENEPLKDYDSAENRGKENARPFSRKLSKQTLTNKPKDVVPPDGNRKQKGGYKFIKIDDSKEKNRLANAVFAVFIENDKGEYIPYVVNEKGQYAPNDKDAKRLTLKSASNGEFEVQNLPHGKYILRETAAPNGYILDVNPIKFEITSNSYEKDAIMIVNKKDTKKTVVPPTVTPPGKTNTPGTTPPSTTVKPPTTYYVPGNKTRIPRGPLVKTGDIRIVILVALGIVMIVAGSIIVNKDEKNQKIQLA